MGQHSTSLLRKVFGDPLSQRNAEQWPELATSWAGRQVEMPNEAAKVNKLRPMNFIEKAILPGAAGVTWPWGTIALNQNEIKNNGLDLGDTLAHEVKHASQNTVGGFLKKLYNAPSDMMKPYHEKSQEKEAFNYEYNRPVRRYDINLNSPRDTMAANKPIQKTYNTVK